jgi:DNA (cytosine-5)-methyltransferase 1
MITNLELFSGAGGLALGLEKAGFYNIALNEFDKDACQTLRKNRPEWNIIEGDIHNIDFTFYINKVDLLSGGFPCQAFSHSGKRLGLEDTRGTLFYEFARAIKEIQPMCFLAENVKGLLTHDNGKTIEIILNVFKELNYFVFQPVSLNANDYEVAQKRERIFIFGVKKEFKNLFVPLKPTVQKKLILRDIFEKTTYYNQPCPESKGMFYSEKKKKFFEKIPPGGYWKNLNIEEQKLYMGNMFFSKGGKTGVLRRLSLDEPSLTLLTSPSQKQTERCHPLEVRPLNIREYARIQSFPDDWIFFGSISSQYRQIGNAVPVNLAYHVGLDIINQIKKIKEKL